MSKPVYVFIICWERPLYLWACLDALFRNTSTDCRFVLINNNSQDPLVEEVVAGFDRRGLFHKVHNMEENSPNSFERILAEYDAEIDDTYVYLESDIVVAKTEVCWLEQMLSMMRDNKRLAMLGSRIDPTDFVDEARAKLLTPDLNDAQRANLIKLQSPERIPQQANGLFTDASFNPPGRLVMYRKHAVEEVGFKRDSKLNKALIAADYETGIAYGVLHRHLSLLNFFDYPDYDYDSRENYFSRAGQK